MLELAIKAKIPILRAKTTDILNLPGVLKHIAPKAEIVEAKGGQITSKGQLVYAVDTITVNRQRYDDFASDERTLLLINQGEDSPFAFDAGEVPVPKDLMEDLLGMVIKKASLREILPAFNGLTLKGMEEVIRLTQARDKTLSVRGITQIRAMLTGSTPGLGQVSTDLGLYICSPQLAKWTEENKRYFLEAPHPRLVPRGVLLAGEPGVGKSQGSKYIATQWEIPLYRLDLAAMGSKWVFESEANLARLLATLDQEEPAEMLVDEGEKLFGESEDQGTTSRLLSQLLWWMAEHKSRVLTVITTNNKKVLPGELYRAGRIDKVMDLDPLNFDEAMVLAVASLGQFFEVEAKHKKEMNKALHSIMKSRKHGTIPHAEVVQLSVDLLKEKEWLQF